jgi:hypothetical protein
MLIFLLILVEEDIFNPILPPPKVEPEVEWFKKLEKNWINVALNREIDYNFVAFKFRELTLESLNKRDFTNHYSLKASLQSLSYNLQTNYVEWDRSRYSNTTGWKWFSEDQSYFLGWFETFSSEDSVTADLGVRLYQFFEPFFIGGWANYKESLDYGLIMQIFYLRGELGKERKCVGFVNDWGEIKLGRFRDRFPTFFFPIENFFPKVIVFYGASINIFDFNFIGGRKYLYAVGEDTLSWEEGKVYFADIHLEKEKFGFKYFYQNKGVLREYGEIHLNSGLGIVGSQLCLTGYLTPRRFIAGGFSLYLRTKISPFFSIKNLSWAPESNFQKPVYYLGIRYAQ